MGANVRIYDIELPRWGPDGKIVRDDKGKPALGRKVSLKEMGTEALLMAFSQAGSRKGEQAITYATKVAALRLCVVEVDGEATTYAMLTGPLWDTVFSLKETTLLIHIWGQIHDADQDDLDVLGKDLRTTSGG